MRRDPRRDQAKPLRFPGGAGGFTLMEILIAMSIFLLVVFAIYSSFETSRATYGAGEQKADIQQSARIAMELMERDLRHAGYGFPDSGADCDGDFNPDNPIMVANATSITFCADLVNASTIILDVDVNPGDITLNVEDASGIQAGDTIYLINGGDWEPLTVQAVNTGINPHTITTTAGAAIAYPWGTKVGRPLPVTYCACVDPDAAGPLPWTCAALNFNTLCNDAGDGAGLQPLADNIQTFQFQYAPTANPPDIRLITITLTAQSPPGWWRPQTFNIASDVRPRNLN